MIIIKDEKTFDLDKRNAMLNVSAEDFRGTIARFTEADFDALKRLMQDGFIKRCSCQNDSPEAIEFINFIERYPFVTAHGFVREKTTETILEGIGCNNLDHLSTEKTLDFVLDFYNLCRYADICEVDENSAYAWWD